MRGPKPLDALRENVADLVPHVRDAVEGGGWQWSPIKGDGGLDPGRAPLDNAPVADGASDAAPGDSESGV